MGFFFSLFLLYFLICFVLYFAFTSFYIHPSYLSNKKERKKNLQLICVMSFGQNDSI